MTEYTKRFVIVVTQEQKNIANQKSKLVDKEGGEKTWTVGLSKTGKGNPTHFWCNWQMKSDETVNLKKFLEEIPGHNEQIFELSHWDSAIAKPTIEEIQEMINLKPIDIT